MRKNLVITLTGHDRIGIVEHVTKRVLEYDGNVEESRMARLGGEFAMLVLVSVPIGKFEALQQGINELKKENYQVSTCQTEQRAPEKFAGWMPYMVKLSGADHEGIIHRVTEQLAQRKINIESMDTSTIKAPMSGTPLLMMTAIVVVPPELNSHDWQNELVIFGDELNVDIEISPYTG